MRYKKYEWNHKNINEIKYVFHTPEVEKECQSSHRHLDISYQQRTSLCYCALSFDESKLDEFMLPGGSDGKESACSAVDLSLSPGLGRSPGEGHGNPLQDSCLENPTDRETWQAAVPGVAKSWT